MPAGDLETRGVVRDLRLDLLVGASDLVVLVLDVAGVLDRLLVCDELLDRVQFACKLYSGSTAKLARSGVNAPHHYPWALLWVYC
jgi:hypothetical protein